MPCTTTLIIMLFPLASHTTLFRAFHLSIFLLIVCGFLSALFSANDVIPTSHLQANTKSMSSLDS